MSSYSAYARAQGGVSIAALAAGFAGADGAKLHWIFFDFDKSDLRTASNAELDKLAKEKERLNKEKEDKKWEEINKIQQQERTYTT